MSDSIEGLLDAVEAVGVELWVEGSRLRFRAPAEGIPDQLKADLVSSRDEIIASLRTRALRSERLEPLAFNQLGIWMECRLAPESAAYHVGTSFHVSGPLDRAALETAIQTVQDRHESLRTEYPDIDGEPRRRVRGAVASSVEWVAAGEWDTHDLIEGVQREYQRPMDLALGPLFRLVVFRRSEEDHVVLVVLHHLSSDGISTLLLVQEIFSIYTATESGQPLPSNEEAASYEEFVEGQRAWILGPESEPAKAFWKEVLSPPPAPLEFSTDSGFSASGSEQGGLVVSTVPLRMANEVRTLARDFRTTPFTVLLSVFFVLLHRLTGQDDLTVGTPVHGRPSSRFSRTVGHFVNTIPLRIRNVEGLRFHDLLHTLSETTRKSIEHQDLPLPLMMKEARTGRPGAPFQTLFSFHEMLHSEQLAGTFSRGSATEALNIGRLTLSEFPLSQQQGQFDLALELVPGPNGLCAEWKYRAEILTSGDVRAWAERFETLLASILEAPEAYVGELDLLSAADRAGIREWNRTKVHFPAEATLLTLLRSRAQETPHRIAVEAGRRSLSFEELDRRSNQLAHHLRRCRQGPGSLVGLCVHRTCDMVVGLLGILKSGAAYVPLDPSYPTDRLAFMVEDGGVEVVVTQESLESLLAGPRAIRLDADGAAIALESAETLEELPTPQDLAYVIYTSGSTGKPKGVEIPHGALVNFLRGMEQTPGFHASDVLVAVTTISFDISGLEIFLPLTTGGRVVLVERDVAADGWKLADVIEASGATVMQATPATWRLLIESGWKGRDGLRMLCGGEALPRDLIQPLLDRGSELWNMYGPTETTIWSTVERIHSADGPILIGRPIANTQVYVLDPRYRPVPIGVVGELYIGGAGVARGYRNRPELTAERFVELDVDGTGPRRLYRTGDLARWRADGRLECLGRTDHQVKIRGHRIELGEIEAALVADDAVGDAVVVAAGGTGDRPPDRLAAYVTAAASEQDPDPGALRARLRDGLPPYMVPATISILPEIPRLPNGKVDRRALLELEAHGPTSRREDPRSMAPRTEMEGTIADIWRDLLGIADVATTDTFFDLGGHSLLSVTCAVRLEARTGLRINPGELIVQTLEQLAASCEERLGVRSPSAPTTADRDLSRGYGGASREEPFYFGTTNSPLFGLLHKIPEGEPARCAALFSYPMGQEYMRSHRAFVQLARRLAREGTPALRFDFQGCGDSAGSHEEARLGRWIGDLHLAMKELSDRARSEERCIVGLRLGATLAAIAASEREDVDRLVLWNPIVNGAAHRDELRTMHRAMMRRAYVRPDRSHRVSRGTVELMGFPVADELLSGIAELNLMQLDRSPASKVLLIDTVGDRTLDALATHLERLGCATELRRFDGPALWLEEPFKEVVPADVWQHVLHWLRVRSDA